MRLTEDENDELTGSEPGSGAADLARRVKERYPEYRDVDDAELVKRIVAKYPEYADYAGIETQRQAETVPDAVDIAAGQDARRQAPHAGPITARQIDALLAGENGGRIRRFFEAVKRFEGGAPNLIVGGRRTFDPSGDHPNVVGLRTAQGPSTAAGNYQITGTNWYRKGLKQRLGAKNFSPENQLRAAVMMFADRDRGAGLAALLAGDYVTAEKIAAQDWAALPSSRLHGKDNSARLGEFLQIAGQGAEQAAELPADGANLTEPPAPEMTTRLPFQAATPENLAGLGLWQVGPAPEPESEQTIESQVASAAAPDSPRAAVLLTEPQQYAQLPRAVREHSLAVPTAYGILVVDRQKANRLGLSTEEVIGKAVEENGPAFLLGKIENVEDTSAGNRQGITVRTTGRDGHELTSSIVTTPLGAIAQMRADRAAHREAVGGQELLPTGAAIAARRSGREEWRRRGEEEKRRRGDREMGRLKGRE